MNDLAPALYFADTFYVVPPIRNENYISTLLDICEKEQIRLLVPTIDTELEKLAINVEEFKKIGTTVLISDKEFISITNDKRKTYKMFKKIGVKTPESFWEGKAYRGTFPCFIKPISGSSSINAFKVNNKKELIFFKYYIGDYIIQELIEGQEYTIDVFCDFSGNPIYITPRLRIATRSGEVAKAKIENDKKLIEDVKKIIAYAKPKGPVTIQAIKSVLDNEFYFIEINARFGGGSPLSMKAGANSIEALYELLDGKKLQFKQNAARPNYIFLRFDQSIALYEGDDGNYQKI
ncbi:MAG TPA: ATP-grasp domain-containing protein [Clostridiales bacterium]|nr:ATP-grasp domain-containing protein [Clostridiales bacterium]